MVDYQPLYSYIATMKTRHITQRIHAAMKDTPVVLLAGARQVGKSTLARALVTATYSPRYVTLDNPTIYAAARIDPVGFLDGLGTPVIIDEVQRVPELFPAIKYRVDQARKPAMYLLTGSANVLVIPKASESLAGRMEIITLWPFSQSEVRGIQKNDFVKQLFKKSFSFSPKGITRQEISNLLLTGGYPVVTQRRSKSRRTAWFQSYITSLIQRDVRDLSQLDHISLMPKLLELFAARSSTLSNAAELSRAVGIPETTLKRYMALLEAIFLIVPIQSYSGNLSKRVIKTPKNFLNDTGLMSALLNLKDSRSEIFARMYGQLLETYVAGELLKQSGWSDIPFKLFHYRTHTGTEVDFVIESPYGIIGIEVKAASQVDKKQFRGLQTLADEVGKKFIRGVVLYTGSEVVPFTRYFHAIPVNTLWSL